MFFLFTAIAMLNKVVETVAESYPNFVGKYNSKGSQLEESAI